MTQAAFADLEIRIFPRQEEGYPVKIRLDGQQEFPHGYLRADILSWIPSGDLRTDGQRLFATLFEDTSLRSAWDRALGQSLHRRIRLWVDTDAPELHTFPWELLHDGETFLTADAATPLSRYLPSMVTWDHAVLQGPLRVLVVIANPTDLIEYDLAPLDITQERDVLEAALAALPPNRRHFDVLDAPVTLIRLEDKLREGYHILHLVGHGAFNPRQKRAGLYLQDEHGNTEIVTADAFAAMLKRLSVCPRLVFLAACQTAKRDTADAFVGFGPELVNVGIPAVVAMQDAVAIGTARTLSHTFYKQLVRHGRADLALNEARSTLLTAHRPDAAVPVLFMRLKDGQLWAPPERHDFYQHIPLPLHYIPRPDVLVPIQEALLEDPAGLALTSAVKMNALHGMGGIGKTVIARALCDDPEVQAAFPDGILWTTLGSSATEAELRIKLREWLNRLGGVVGGEAPTLNELKSALAQTLANRACLLIVDDVWQRTHAETFQVGGASCRLLLTTRDAEISRALGATLQPVDVLPEAQAIALLEQWAEGHLDDTDLNLKQHIVTRLGCLPLALKLAGAQLRDETPEDWLQAFEIGDLEAPRIECLHDSLVTTFAHSLGQLSAHERQRYVSLAIFREDEPVPVTAIAKLWEAQGGLSRRKVIRLLKDLASRALLQITETPEELSVTLHDLLRDFIAAKLGEQGALAAHRVLLDAYHTTKAGKGWHTAPDDGYLYMHLTYHLDAVSDYGTLRTLFADDAWMHARVTADNYTYDGYLADLSLVWTRAQVAAVSPKRETDSPLAVADCVHYALIQTTTNTLASNYAPELVARAVETGLWSSARGVSIARQIADAEKRARMFIALMGTGRLPDTLCVDAQRLSLDAVRAILNEKRRVEVLVTLAPQLKDNCLTEGLAVARMIVDATDRAKLLATFASQLTGTTRLQTLAEGLAIVRTINEKKSRAEVLITLASQLTGDLLAEGLALTCTIANKGHRTSILAALAPRLTSEHLMKGLALARTITDKLSWWVEVLAALAPQFADEAQNQVLMEGLATARSMTDDEGIQTRILIALAPQLTDEPLIEGLRIARRIADVGNRAKALTALASQFTGIAKHQILTEGLAAANAMVNQSGQVEVLIALAAQLADNLLTESLVIARSMSDAGNRAKILTVLAQQVTGTARDQILAEGLAAVRVMTEKREQAKILVTLVSQLTGDLLVEALTATREIADIESRAKVLIALAAKFAGAKRTHVLTEALATVCEIWPPPKEELVVALVSQLTDDLLREGLTAACAIKDELYRRWILEALVPRLTDNLLAEGMIAARTITDDFFWTRVLVTLAPRLKGILLKEGLAMAGAITAEWNRAEALVALAPQTTGDLLVEGLEVAYGIGNEEYRAQVLVALAPQLKGELLAEGLDAACVITDDERRTKVLAALAPQLTGELLVKGLTTAFALTDDETLATILVALIPQLTDDLLIESLTATRAIVDESLRAEVLVTLVPQLKGDILRESLSMAGKITSEWLRAEVLVALAPQLTGNFLVEGLTAARLIKNKDCQAEVLIALASRLKGKALLEALVTGLASVRVIESAKERVEKLAMLAMQFRGIYRSWILIKSLVTTYEIWNLDDRIKALITLTPQLKGIPRILALVRSLVAVHRIKDENETIWAEFLTALLLQLKGISRALVLTKGLAAARKIVLEYNRAEALAKFAPLCTGDRSMEVLAAVHELKHEASRAKVLAALAPQLADAIQEQILAEGLAAARAIESEAYRADVLVALCPQLTDALLREGLAVALATTDEWYRARALEALVPQLNGDLLIEGVAAARALEHEGCRVDVLEALALSTNTSGPILEDIRQTLSECLWDMRNRERATLLELLTDDDLAFLRALGVSQEGFNQIAQSVIAVCTRWEWL